MNPSPFRRTIVLFTVMLLLLVVVVFFTGEENKKARKDSLEGSPVLSSQQINQIDEVLFASADEELLLSKASDGQWTVADFSVDDALERELEETLANLPRGKRVSRNEQNWARYGVDEASAHKMVVRSAGSDLRSFYLGTPGPAFGSVHMRAADETEVYLVESEVKSLANYNLVKWRDKSLFDLDLDDLSQVNVRVDEQRWSFVKNGSWQYVSEAGSVDIPDQESFMSYLEELVSLEGIGIENNSALFQSPSRALSLTTLDGQEFVAQIQVTEDERFLVQLAGRDELLTLSSDPESLLRPSMALSDPAAGQLEMEVSSVEE